MRSNCSTVPDLYHYTSHYHILCTGYATLPLGQFLFLWKITHRHFRKSFLFFSDNSNNRTTFVFNAAFNFENHEVVVTTAEFLNTSSIRQYVLTLTVSNPFIMSGLVIRVVLLSHCLVCLFVCICVCACVFAYAHFFLTVPKILTHTCTCCCFCIWYNNFVIIGMFEQSFLLDRTVVRCFFSVGALEVYISLKFVFPPDLFTVCQCII